MAIQIRDEHLEQQVAAEGNRRGDNTMAKTLSDLARERLVDLESKRRGPIDDVETAAAQTAPVS